MAYQISINLKHTVSCKETASKTAEQIHASEPKVQHSQLASNNDLHLPATLMI